MKFNFKKISAIGSSLLLAGMSIAAPIAAANYPAPFVVGGSGDVSAIVFGANAATLDGVLAGKINDNLNSYVTTTSTGTSGSVTGGDAFLIAKTSDRLNINDTWGVFSGTVTEDNLATLLADGTYLASDNDEFNYEQKITLGAPVFDHFRDSDYEALVGLDERTPTLGFKIGSSTLVLNYTIDFLQDAETDLLSLTDAEDIEGSDLPLMGKTYYVSDLKNGTSNTNWGVLTLLDSANTATVTEGETITVAGPTGTSYEIGIAYIDSNEVKFIIDGQTVPANSKLMVGQTYKLSDGSYLGCRDISKLEVSGELGSATFSIGSGKLELTHGANVKMNDVAVDGVKAYTFKSSGSTTTPKIDKIEIEWKTDDEAFLTSESSLLMPGFEALEFKMNPLMRSEEEKIILDKDGDTSIKLTLPIKDGTVSINLLYSEAVSGNFTGLGKASDERLATSNGTTLNFTQRTAGSDFHEYFVASYNITGEAESYLLRAKVSEDTTNARNETDVEKYTGAGWVNVCEEKIAAETCNIGDVTLTFTTVSISPTGTEKSVVFTAGSNVHFNTVYTPGGLRIYLPFEVVNASTDGLATLAVANPGAINVTSSINPGDNKAGHSEDSFYLYMDGEDKDDNIAAGTLFSLTLDRVSATNTALHIPSVNTTGGGAGSGSGGTKGLEVGDSSGVYEAYIGDGKAVDEVSPRILHYTKPDEDYAEIYYPSGHSETYAEVYLGETDAVISAGSGATSGGTSFGYIVVSDSEVASVSSKNLIVVGGTCINSAAATVLGVAKGTCGAGFTTATGVGSGQFLIQSVADAYTTGKIALVVAGYEVAETQMATTYLTTQKPDVSAGKKYTGTSSTTAILVTE